MNHQPHLLPKVRSKLIMSSMENGPCTLRIASFVPGRRCAGPETSVGAHLPIWGKGMSTKVTDMAVACACQACHDILDGRDMEGWKYVFAHCPSAIAERMLHGLTETHALLIDRGVIIIPDGEMI